MRRSRFAVLIALIAAITALITIAPTASAHSRAASVRIAGAVAAPTAYTVADLAALPQTTLPDDRRHRPAPDLTGVLLEPLVTAAQPELPSAKNALLRVTLTVQGRHHSIAIALGEITPRFGSHPALLVTGGRGRHAAIDLVFPGDRGVARTVADVRSITVQVAAPAVPTDLPPGAVTVTDGHRRITITAARLSRLPAITRTVTYASGSGQQTHTETGPTLATVLRAARFRATPTTSVAAVADDGYAATVTPAEARIGRRPLLLSLSEDGKSLTQPRLVVDGDLAGGRYVTGVLGLEIRDGR